MSFFAELKRRNILKVAAYIIVAWLTKKPLRYTSVL